MMRILNSDSDVQVEVDADANANADDGHLWMEERERLLS